MPTPAEPLWGMRHCLPAFHRRTQFLSPVLCRLQHPVHGVADLGSCFERAKAPAAARVRRRVHRRRTVPPTIKLGGGVYARLSPPFGDGYGSVNRALRECLDPTPVVPIRDGGGQSWGLTRRSRSLWSAVASVPLFTQIQLNDLGARMNTPQSACPAGRGRTHCPAHGVKRRDGICYMKRHETTTRYLASVSSVRGSVVKWPQEVARRWDDQGQRACIH